jgi:hypothetical protein
MKSYSNYMGLFGFKTAQDRRNEKRALLIAEANAFVHRVKAAKALAPITSNLLTKEGEEVFLETPTVLKETRSVREYHGSGGRVRIMKGVSVGGGSGRSESHQEWRVVDQGKLTITGKRLIFNGGMGDRVIPIEKIISVDPTLDEIEISSESRSKSMLFSVPNPFIWATCIHLISKVEDPKKIEAELTFQFK